MSIPADDQEPEPSGWNIWLTLMVIAAIFSVLIAVLEYLGVFRDLGLVLSLGSIALALTFGLTGSSQRTVELLRFSLRGVRRDLGHLGGDVGALREVAVRGFAETTRGIAETNRGIAEINLGIAEINRGVAQTNRGLVETNRGLGETTRGIGEIAALLRDRLPRP